MQNLVLLLIICIILPHKSIQQATINATCDYKYSDNIYSCYLSTPLGITQTDILEITGTHLPNHTDADVEEVAQITHVVEYFNGEVLKKFENLKSIVLLGGPLYEINPNAFDVCPKLENLSMDSNQLKTFPSGMLKNCANLINFSVVNLEVLSVPENLFGMTSNLESFSLLGNLPSLPEKLFQNMRNLRYLNIASNQLTELSPNFLINSPNLEEFVAYLNNFQQQNDIAFALNGRTNLRVLWLSNNNFSNFDFQFFSQFQKLEDLFIGSTSGPKLTNISWHSLPRSLISLFVDGINENIPENAFNRLEGLQILSIHGFGIDSLHEDTFKPLTNLFKLFIAGTRINSLPSGLFVNQKNLIQLVIKSAQIYRLNANSFGDHPNLRTIDFGFNKINAIERGIFSKFHPDMTLVSLWSNVCVSQYLNGVNLDNNKELSTCFTNWENMPDIPPTTTTTTTTTTPSVGCVRNFYNFKILFLFILIFFYFEN